jgi:hypothetical protein
MHRSWLLRGLIVCLAACHSLVAQVALPPGTIAGDLQGLHKEDSTNFTQNSPWTSVNLMNWRELDYIPVRAKLHGGPATNQYVSVIFPHFDGTPGFESVSFISNSPNVIVVSGPTLASPPEPEDWTYSLQVDITDDQDAYIYFYARLAFGAHLNPGSSLHLRGEPSLSPLQIHKPDGEAGSPDLGITKDAPAIAQPGEVITYTIKYTNRLGIIVTADGEAGGGTLPDSTATDVRITDLLPSLVTYVPGSATQGGTLSGNVLTWNLGDLPVGASGSVSYQVTVSPSAISGDSFTNYALIFSAENDANTNDNRAAVVTTVVSSNVTIRCSVDRIVEAGAEWTFDAPVATGGCGPGAPAVTILSTVTNRVEGDCAANFTATRTWVATDICGNSNTCSQTITVRDTTPPTLLCAGDRTVEIGTDWAFEPPTAGAGATVVILSTVTNVSGLCGFQAIRRWAATDACGNSNTCSQTVTVVDTTPPVIVCSTNKIVEAGTPWNFDPPNATDNGGGVTVAIVNTETNISEGCANTFTATRTWRATDDCGLTATCSQTVTVVDTTGPIINCSVNRTVEFGTDWTFDTPTVSDNGGVVSLVIISTVTNRVEFCGNTFEATRMWMATDGCGRSNTCSQTVTVHDTTPPAISIISPTNGSSFLAPATFTIVTDASDANGVAQVTFLAGTNVLGTVASSPFFLTVSNFAVGDYALRAVATDLCGLLATSAVVNIHVFSNPPIIALGPVVLNRQNGLFEQSVRVLNPTPSPWPNGLRIYISDLGTTNQVWNADGTNNGLPYLEDTSFVPAGGSVDFLIQYYVPNPRVVPMVTLTAVPNPAPPAAPAPLALDKALPLTNGKFCVEFASQDQRIYFIQCSYDLQHWTTVSSPIVGNGQRIKWFDNAAQGKCFYRAVCVP